MTKTDLCRVFDLLAKPADWFCSLILLLIEFLFIEAGAAIRNLADYCCWGWVLIIAIFAWSAHLGVDCVHAGVSDENGVELIGVDLHGICCKRGG
jgi:hypothetical protein